MKRLSLVLMILILMLSGCSIKRESPINRNFKGESEHWIGFYSMQGSTSTQVTKAKIVYKGSDVESVGKIKYLFETSAGGLGGEELLPNQGFITSSGSSGNAAVVQKDEKISVTITWKGQIEKLTLTPTNVPLDI